MTTLTSVVNGFYFKLFIIKKKKGEKESILAK